MTPSAYEALLSDVIAEIIGACVEYAGPNVSEVFVYASLEVGYSVDPFFAQDATVVLRHKIPGVDASAARQRSLLEHGIAQLKRLSRDGATLGAAVPSNMQLHYTMSTGALDAEFTYGPTWSLTADDDSFTVAEAWMVRVQDALTKGEPAPM